MAEEVIRQLLLECGFKSAPRKSSSATGFRWAVKGELDGGFELVVQCMTGARGGIVLLVPSEGARQLLLDMLAQNGAPLVDVRSEEMQPRAQGPWLPITVGVGVGALALFGWVLTSIQPFFP
jgi:hypothetical protein